MPYIKAYRSSKFGQIQLLVSMATDRVIMEKTALPYFPEKNNNNKKQTVKMLPHFLGCFFIRSFSYLQVIMACMRARRSSKFVQI